MRVVLLGPPGVGKGTQGRRLAGERGWLLISTGEILRDAAERQTQLGIEARRQMDRGLLVSDDVMIGLVRERTTEEDAGWGFVLDGFPRTVPQAEALDSMLMGRGQHLDAVLYLKLDEEELVRRMSGRRECPVCKRAYNIYTAPSKDGVHCDDHPNVELIRRLDDEPETVKRRIAIYQEQTAPLVDYYRRGCKLREVDGAGTPETVYVALRGALDGTGR